MRPVEEEEEEFAMATKRLKSNKSAQLHFVQSAALTMKIFEILWIEVCFYVDTPCYVDVHYSIAAWENNALPVSV